MERFLVLLTILSLAVLALDYEDDGTRQSFYPTLKRGRGNNSLHEHSENRFLLHDECQNSLQKQINMELYASLAYMNMAAHFQRLDVGRAGFAKYFHENSDEEKEHAEKLIKYINRRGGAVSNFDVKMPKETTFVDALDALRHAVKLEESVNNALHEVHQTAEQVCKDPHLMDFLEAEFLEEQVESISKLRTLTTVLSKMPDGMGEYLLDKELDGHKTEL